MPCSSSGLNAEQLRVLLDWEPDEPLDAEIPTCAGRWVKQGEEDLWLAVSDEDLENKDDV